MSPSTEIKPGKQNGDKPKLAFAIATAGGVGYASKAPGTLGSLVGVGTIVPTERMDRTAFINLIDAQLYHAKENGRNRIAAVDRAGMQGEAFKSHSR